jgi:hypothetical protein
MSLVFLGDFRRIGMQWENQMDKHDLVIIFISCCVKQETINILSKMYTTECWGTIHCLNSWSSVLLILTCVTPQIIMMLVTREIKLVRMRTINRTLAAEKRKFIINLMIIYEADILRPTHKYKMWTRPKKLALQDIRHNSQKPDAYFIVKLRQQVSTGCWQRPTKLHGVSTLIIKTRVLF